MDRSRAEAFIAALHSAQEELYAGGDPEPVRRLLAPEIVWYVPGSSPIAGSHRGADAVIDYMIRRRDIAGGSFRMFRRNLLVGDGETFAVLTDGRATIGGRNREWSTLGLYRLAGDRLAECRLVPFDQAEFDAIWGWSDPRV
jgi:ketosteroid isomerase-like protein